MESISEPLSGRRFSGEKFPMVCEEQRLFWTELLHPLLGIN